MGGWDCLILASKANENYDGDEAGVMKIAQELRRKFEVSGLLGLAKNEKMDCLLVLVAKAGERKWRQWR